MTSRGSPYKTPARGLSRKDRLDVGKRRKHKSRNSTEFQKGQYYITHISWLNLCFLLFSILQEERYTNIQGREEKLPAPLKDMCKSTQYIVFKHWKYWSFNYWRVSYLKPESLNYNSSVSHLTLHRGTKKTWIILFQMASVSK